jgi:phospho-N-acetylmuramoyl-pentapeptide-transferase
VRYITFRAGAATGHRLMIGLIIGPDLSDGCACGRARASRSAPTGPESHHAKRGTPTMGGLMILTSLTVAMLLWMDFSNKYLWACLFITVGFG